MLNELYCDEQDETDTDFDSGHDYDVGTRDFNEAETGMQVHLIETAHHQVLTDPEPQYWQGIIDAYNRVNS